MLIENHRRDTPEPDCVFLVIHGIALDADPVERVVKLSGPYNGLRGYSRQAVTLNDGGNVLRAVGGEDRLAYPEEVIGARPPARVMARTISRLST